MPHRIAQPGTRGTIPLLMLLAAIISGPALASVKAQDDAPEASIDQAIEAWLHIRPWIDDLHVPASERITDEQQLGPHVNGVSIILRFGGRVLGVGEAHDRGRDTLRRAVASAVLDARNSKRVQDLPFDMIESIGRATTIELELRHTPEPLLGGSFEDTTATIKPGLDGLAIRRGSDWQWSFPGRMQAFGLADRPDRALVRMLRGLGLPPKTPEELRRIDDVEFYRFEVTVLTQDSADGMPFESIRGTRRINRTAELQEQARELAEGAASNLMIRLASDPLKEVGDIPGAARLSALGLFGDYNLNTDAYKPLVAPAADQALAAWAMARYAREAPGVSEEDKSTLWRIADLVIERLKDVDPVEKDPLADTRCVPLIILAGMALYGDVEDLDPGPRMPEIITEARKVFVEGLKARQDGTEPPAPDGLLALNALAACSLARTEPDLVSPEEARRLLEDAWRTPEVNSLVGSLHFLILADRQLPLNPTIESHQAASHHLIEGAIANQIGHPDSISAPVAPARDLDGGFVLSGTMRVTAGASSLRPALALATAARSGWFPKGARAEAWQDALELALRFARQLQVDGTQTHRTPSPGRAEGGIKSSPWSAQSRASDTSLALLLATEILAADSN
jgi:hypothetical protein